MTGMLNLSGLHQPIAALIAEQLDQVSLIFERQLASDMSAVNSLCMHVEQYRGKMLRPTLVLLSGLAAGAGAEDEARGDDGAANDTGTRETIRQWPSELVLTEKHRILAAVVEMIHMATLVHDDVLDESSVRRRGATVNHLWGNETAVILGDYLISNAFHLCSTMDDPAINLALGEVTNILCEGELVQLHHRNDYSIDEATYLEIVRRKTASLIGECCRLGAALSGAPAKVSRAMHRYGTALGIAFQIQDDLLDLIGDPAMLGKPLGQDLEKGKLTLPVILYLSEADAIDRGEALRLISQGDAPGLRARLLESGAVERTRDAALRLVDEAREQLVDVPLGPARELLAALAQTVVVRAS